jgi:hypothetical protein
MSVALNKLFLQEESPFTDDCLQPLNRLFQQKKAKVAMFYTEFIDLREAQDLSIEAIFEEQNKTKFSHHTMCLSLSHINSLYNFFAEYKQHFTASKQAVSVLTDDINYMDNEAKILSNDPVRQDTMMFKKGPVSAEDHNINTPGPKKVLHIDYFPFYKAYDRSAKIDKQ